MKNPPINWSEVPTSKAPMLRIVRAPVHGRADFVILSARDFGVFVHWDDRLRRNVPCTDPHGCICQDREVGTSWKTYLAAVPVNGGKVVLVEVTADAWRAAHGVDVLKARGSLRGFRLTLSRTRREASAPVVAGLFGPVGTLEAALPESPNVKDELQRIWYSRL